MLTTINWGFAALLGIGIVFLGNVLRARRTKDAGCLGHLFVSAADMTLTEQVLNRSGIALFAIGIILALVY